jgi:hypothetical protein
MAVTCDRARTAYFPVPKVACTSLKVFFWEINNGRSRPDKIALASRLRRKLGLNIFGETLQSEEGYRTLDFDPQVPVPDGFDRVAVIRDPLARLHSAWSNKVKRDLFERHREVAMLEANGLSPAPTFAQFIDHYDEYRKLSVPVRRHTGSFTQYLGNDLGWFNQVFQIEELDRFERYVQDRVGFPVRIPSRNRRKPDPRNDRLGAGHLDKVAGILADDYRLLRDFYDVESSLKKFLQATVA